MQIYFYHKPNRLVEPVSDKSSNKKAKEILDDFYQNRVKLKIPSKFIDKWEKVALYHPKGNLDKANSILIEPEKGV